MEILTISEASKICGVSLKTLINWTDAGHLKAYKTLGGHRRIQRDELYRFMEEHHMPIPKEEKADTRKRILVVDDDKIIVESIVLALEEDEHGYEVISAGDGFEAGLQVSHFKPDILILDIMMPDINGYEVCKRIKSNPESRHIKVVVLSAYLDEHNFNVMKGYGADACFSKPLPLPDLRKEIAQLLGI
ncbi:MAG: response regulator [Methanoregula sp.]|jgi:excisionase family DNA binding protein|uniref:response regulator n=1 Tax=Methanoregula sp. TaxID=2052170 RepID=UPI003C1E9BE7